MPDRDVVVRALRTACESVGVRRGVSRWSCPIWSGSLAGSLRSNARAVATISIS
jgi:hypothetical protein